MRWHRFGHVGVEQRPRPGDDIGRFGLLRSAAGGGFALLLSASNIKSVFCSLVGRQCFRQRRRYGARRFTRLQHILATTTVDDLLRALHLEELVALGFAFFRRQRIQRTEVADLLD